MAMTVFVLQALAVERGAPGGRALHLLLTLTRTNFCIVSLWDNPIQSKGAVALAKVLAHDSQSSLTVLL